MRIAPNAFALRRHKIAATLIVIQIALTCAIVANVLFLIHARVARMDEVSGVPERELVAIFLGETEHKSDPAPLTRKDLETLRALPGVKAATITGSLPLASSLSFFDARVWSGPDKTGRAATVTLYMGDDLFGVFGLRVSAGRAFELSEVFDASEMSTRMRDAQHPPAIMLTRAAAERLFPGESAVGKLVYAGPSAARVVGVVDRLARSRTGVEPGSEGQSLLAPVRIPYTEGGYYVLRVDPERRTEILRQATAALMQNARRAVIIQSTYEDLRREHFRQDRAMTWILIAACAALLVVTALGIIGLASFWVQQRTRDIGIRRALGATRGQILRHFHGENFFLTSIGITFGMGLAVGLNAWLMQAHELPRLPASYLPVGAVALWILGQVAVLAPARRAAAVPPAVATRTV